MASVRHFAACIGYPGGFSTLRDFFGFRRDQLPADPTGAPVRLSLERQIQRLRGPHLNLNVFAVGVDLFAAADDERLDYMLFRMRDIYDQVGVGIGRVEHHGVKSADSNGLDSPTTEGELEDITAHWSVENDGLDLFVPLNMNVPSNGYTVLGLSPVGGPCDKDANGMTGSVVGLWGREHIARSGSHEVGHYLGLRHRNGDADNLMCQTSNATSVRNSVVLTSNQGKTIKEHCFIQPGCPSG